MWNSMGMASSIGLGLALARPDLRVVVLDGDGSILMNLSSLATEVTSGARNLVHVIWDNAGWEITGAQPAGSAFGVDLAAIARGCGFLKTATVGSLEDFRHVFAEAIADDEAWVIVAQVEPGDSPYRPGKSCFALRDRFRTALLPAGDGR
jgi:thiamine pyrophosphate-dependent acetolactate synthase large subunit-like protein